VADPRLLLTLGPELPITLVSDLLGGIRQAMVRYGCSMPTMDSMLRVRAVLPAPGTRVEYHEVLLAPSDVHEDMVTWSCSCGQPASSSYGDVGWATFSAVAHVPRGEAWAVVPDTTLWAAGADQGCPGVGGDSRR